MKNGFLKTLVLLATFATLASCANGGGSYTAPSSSTTPSQVGCGSMQGSACDMFVAINQYRSLKNLVAFNSQANCISMAENHATDMYTNNYFSHDSSTQTFKQRVAQFGLTNSFVTESIARGSNSVDVILNLLEKSSGDNSALLSTTYQSIGVGFDNGYWTICYTSL